MCVHQSAHQRKPLHPLLPFPASLAPSSQSPPHTAFPHKSLLTHNAPHTSIQHSHTSLRPSQMHLSHCSQQSGSPPQRPLPTHYSWPSSYPHPGPHLRPAFPHTSAPLCSPRWAALFVTSAGRRVKAVEDVSVLGMGVEGGADAGQGRADLSDLLKMLVLWA